MTVFAPRFTSHDPQVEEWWENQRVKSKSLELAIKLLVKQYGTVDIYDAAIESLTRSAGVVPVTEPVKKEVAPKVEVKPKKKVVEEPKQVVASEPTQIDPQELIAASEKPKAPAKKASPQELSPDDILAMMSNQAGSL
jgi:hypothetical protein